MTPELTAMEKVTAVFAAMDAKLQKGMLVCLKKAYGPKSKQRTVNSKQDEANKNAIAAFESLDVAEAERVYNYTKSKFAAPRKAKTSKPVPEEVKPQATKTKTK